MTVCSPVTISKLGIQNSNLPNQLYSFFSKPHPETAQYSEHTAFLTKPDIRSNIGKLKVQFETLQFRQLDANSNPFGLCSEK